MQIQDGLPPRTSTRHLWLILFMVVAWGANVTAVKAAVTQGVEPWTIAAVRFSLALLVVTGWARWTGIRLACRRRELLWLALLAVLFTLQIFTFNLSTKYTTSGRVAVILNAYPFWLALVAGLFFVQDRPTVKKVLGALVAVAGVSVIFRESLWSADRLVFKGDLIVLTSSFLLTAHIILQKRLLEGGIEPVKMLFFQLLFSLPLFWAGALLAEHPGAAPVNAVTVTALAYQGIVVGGLSFITWQYLLKVYPATRLSSYFFLVPFFAVLFGSLLLHEPLTWGLGVGLALILTGIYFGRQ